MGHLGVSAGPRRDVARIIALAQGVFWQSECNKAVIKEAFKWNAWHSLPRIQLERVCKGLQTRGLEEKSSGQRACSCPFILAPSERILLLLQSLDARPHSVHSLCPAGEAMILSMDALIIECTRTRTELWFGHGCSHHRVHPNTNGIMAWAWMLW